MLGKKPLKQPQLPTRPLNRDKLFTSEYSAGLFSLDGSENVNSCNPQYHLEFPNNMIMDFVARNKRAPCGNSEAKLPPPKRPKLESAFNVSLVDNRSSDNWDHEMVKPYFLEAFPKLQEQSESPISCIYSDVNISGEPDPNMHTLCNYTIAADNEGIQDKIGFNQEAVINATKKVIKPYDSNPVLDSISQKKTDDTSEPIFRHTKKTSVQPGGYDKCYKTVIEPDDSNPAVDSISISRMKTDDTSEPIFSSEIISFEDIEVVNITNEPDPTMHTLYNDTIAADNKAIQDRTGFNQEAGINSTNKVIEPDDSNPMLDSISISQMKTDDTSEPIFSSEIISSEDLEVVNISDEPDPTMHTLCNDTIVADNKGTQDRTGFNQEAGKNATNKVIEPKADQQMEKKFSNATVNIVSLTEIFTSNQIKEHIMSLRKKFIQNTFEEETGMNANTCHLCSMQKLFFEPVPIYCFCCDIRIKRNAFYYYKKAEEFDTQNCFCTLCYKNSRSGHITFNGVSVSKTLLDRRRNDEVIEEAWVQCDKCKRWKHQICALYNNKRELDCGDEYICPIRRLKDIENGMHVPLPKTAIFCAKDLPSTMLSEHLEKRLFSRLMQEREDRAKVEGSENFDEIEGVDVCLFGMYVQEFGSECGYQNQCCVYISYLDSVKYFRPERAAMSGEALRTFVYHELLTTFHLGFIYYVN
ncbi:histone acetyltransferase HAC12-like [Gastrolobium bilobum]|uniref:histone acetyltransferase HAC12-like n=1 Tax=Gastrolobium bilobum TaxID=150636 RepID=UPI002AB16387|nr:histone acetyltransferase HAC12-like [Gastrolobium bilobum]